MESVQVEINQYEEILQTLSSIEQTEKETEKEIEKALDAKCIDFCTNFELSFPYFADFLTDSGTIIQIFDGIPRDSKLAIQANRLLKFSIVKHVIFFIPQKNVGIARFDINSSECAVCGFKGENK